MSRAGRFSRTKSLKVHMGGVQLAAKMLAARGRDLAENRNAALEFAGRHFLKIDVVLFEQAIEVGNLRDNADAAENGEGRGDDPVGGGGHQIAPARRDLIDARGHRDPRRPKARKLRGGKAVSRHRAAGAVDADDDLILAGPRDRQHGVDFAAQLLDRARANVALEVDDVDALARALARVGLRGLLARLGERLALLLGAAVPCSAAPRPSPAVR